jgi:uncharacterized protein YggE
MRKSLLVLGVVGVAMLAFASACDVRDVEVFPQQSAEGIQVSGTGSASGVPDVALLDLGVTVEKDTVAEAREEAAGAMQDVVDSLKDNGVEDKDIQTTRFSIMPVFDYPDGRQVLRGFEVSNFVTAKVRDIDGLDGVLDDAAAAGGDQVQIQNIRFDIDDPSQLEAEAREEAVGEARDKAETLADLSNVELGKPVSISESTSAPPVPAALDLYGRGAEAAAEVPTPIEAGELEVTVTVNVVFAID